MKKIDLHIHTFPTSSDEHFDFDMETLKGYVRDREEVEEAFYRKHMKEWREDQKRLQRQIDAHQEADENYIEQGIRLIEIARNAELIRFIFPNSNLRDSKVEPVFKPPFDIIWKMAKDARKSTSVNKKQTASEPAACPIALPNL